MGEVAVVEHVGLAEQRVMKVLKGHLVADDSLGVRLRTEARLLTRLSHPNLVRVFDFGLTAAGRPFLVTELLQGATLKDHLGPVGMLPEKTALDILAQVLAGLDVVHGAGIVHRDLKPDNLFLTGSPSAPDVKILDFGVAKVLAADQREALGQAKPTAEGMLVGTPLFVSPEQAMGDPVDARADLYSAGCILFRMVTGENVFAKRDLVSLLKAHVKEPPRSPSSLCLKPLHPRTEGLILRALEKSPAARFQSAAEMRAEIDAIRSAIDAATTLPVGQDEDSAHATVFVMRTERVEPLAPPAPAPVAPRVEPPIPAAGRRRAVPIDAIVLLSVAGLAFLAGLGALLWRLFGGAP